MTDQAAGYDDVRNPSCRACESDRWGEDEQVCSDCVALPVRSAKVCPTRTPEVHTLGEFPMTCYRCHLEADS